jgi:hypothetical protein
MGKFTKIRYFGAQNGEHNFILGQAYSLYVKKVMHPQGLPGSVSFELFSFTWIDHKHLSKPKQYHIVQYI